MGQSQRSKLHETNVENKVQKKMIFFMFNVITFEYKH